MIHHTVSFHPESSRFHFGTPEGCEKPGNAWFVEVWFFRCTRNHPKWWHPSDERIWSRAFSTKHPRILETAHMGSDSIPVDWCFPKHVLKGLGIHKNTQSSMMFSFHLSVILEFFGSLATPQKLGGLKHLGCVTETCGSPVGIHFNNWCLQGIDTLGGLQRFMSRSEEILGSHGDFWSWITWSFFG